MDRARFSGLFPGWPRIKEKNSGMDEAKDTRRSTVRLSYDGRVFKTFKGYQAKERFENEKLVLKYLESRGCPFVPRLVSHEDDKLQLVMTNCGQKVHQMSDKKRESLFKELESYGVRHEDAEMRNVTYRMSDGRFCIIDFEFATIIDDPTHKSPMPLTERPPGESGMTGSDISDSDYPDQ